MKGREEGREGGRKGGREGDMDGSSLYCDVLFDRLMML